MLECNAGVWTSSDVTTTGGGSALEKRSHAFWLTRVQETRCGGFWERILNSTFYHIYHSVWPWVIPRLFLLFIPPLSWASLSFCPPVAFGRWTCAGLWRSHDVAGRHPWKFYAVHMDKIKQHKDRQKDREKSRWTNHKNNIYSHHFEKGRRPLEIKIYVIVFTFR